MKSLVFLAQESNIKKQQRLLREICSHLQISEYVTLLIKNLITLYYLPASTISCTVRKSQVVLFPKYACEQNSDEHSTNFIRIFFVLRSDQMYQLKLGGV
jgi:hypothetical protein